jgi:outer membrane protein assembly factor BamB
MRALAAAFFMIGWFAASAVAQSSVYSRATPPDPTALDRLNLSAEWSAYVPVQGRQDGLVRVQVADEHQVFVQTRRGVLVALDATNGREQWKFKFPTEYTDGFSVAVNPRFVFAVNVSKLFCFQRYTGVLEFEVNLPETPATGPVTDGDLLYVAFTGAKVVCYELPPAFLTSEKGIQLAKQRKLLSGSVSESVAARNPGRSIITPNANEVIEQYIVPREYREADAQSIVSQGTPSVSVLQTVVPPYTLGSLNKVVSVSILPSLRRPYTLKPDYMIHNQLTPSISVIPPSLARVLELSNLKPPPFTPQIKWVTNTTTRVFYPPLFVPDSPRASSRLWVSEDGKGIQAISRDREFGIEPQKWSLPAKPAGPLVGPFGYEKDVLLGVLPLTDGQVLGIDLTGGSSSTPKYAWRANVGGMMNRTPIATADGVYVGGDNSGAARINVKTGQVDWRTAADVDRVLAVSDEHVFVRDRRGNLQLYAKGRVSDSVSLIAKPLGVLNVSDFGVNMTNTATDRVILAADNGLVVSLREAGPRYIKPKLVSPPLQLSTDVPPPAKPVAPVPSPGEPKKEEPKK